MYNLEKQVTVSFTYSKTTHESAEHGDHSDTGFYLPSGWEYSTRDDETLADIKKNPGDYEVTDDLESILDTCRNLGIFECSSSEVHSGCWFSSHPETTDYATGENRTLSVHIQGKLSEDINFLNWFSGQLNN